MGQREREGLGRVGGGGTERESEAKEEEIQR